MRGVFYFYKMRGFIRNVVKEIYSVNNNISDYIFILPNKRSGLFLKRELSRITNKTIFSPKIYDIDQFMSMIAGIEKISETELLFEFYNAYLKTTKKKDQETFDEFISWGKTLLKDYNEIDRELCETDKLFDYLKAFKELNHWSNYEKETELIKNYKAFWGKIKVFYSELINRLTKNRKGYQGLIYREACQRIQAYTENRKDIKHIFMGFNALSKSESEVIQEIISCNGEIYWDIDLNLLTSEYNNAGFFIQSYLKQWKYYKKNKIKILSDEYSSEKNINIIGTPKNVGQIKYVGEILTSLDSNQLANTAVILSDEKLLIPVVNSIPEKVNDINVTMGYPLRSSNIYSFFDILLKIHSKTDKSFYYKYIISILSHELISPILKRDVDICAKIKSENLINLTKQEIVELDIHNKNIYDLVFSKWSNPKDGIKNCISLLDLIKKYYSKNPISNSINLELLFNINKVFHQISLVSEKFNYLKNIKSLRAIFKEICVMNSTPFNGEPIVGLQIMGMLETRLLDYDNIIITSLNEGILPAGNKNNSFIPFEIKKANDLQTFKEKDAVFAYHFYRIMQRAKNVWITYNTEPDAMNNGEVSRFVTQLEVERIHKIHKRILVPKTPNIVRTKENYKKTKLVMRKLNLLVEGGVSASMLSLYVLDKIKFFNRYILGVREENIEETIASSTLGNIIHDSLELLYKKVEGKNLDKTKLKEMMEKIEGTISEVSKKYVNKKNLKKGKNIIIIETAKRYVMRILKSDLMSIEKGNKIKIISVEKEFEKSIIDVEKKYLIKGKIDRIDEYNGEIRIIDYKTGKKLYKRDLVVKQVGDIHNEKGIYNLQLIIYALGVFEELNREFIKTGIVSLKNMKDGVLEGRFEDSSEINEEKINYYRKEIIKIIEEILDKGIMLKN